MKIFFPLLVLVVMFLSLGCYTVVEDNTTIKRNRLAYKNHEIVGTWFNRYSGVQHRVVERKLEFFPDGDVTYYPDAVHRSHITRPGKYTIQYGTITIKLFNIPFEETFIFEVENSVLILEKPKTKSRYNSFIQYQDKEYWQRVIF